MTLICLIAGSNPYSNCGKLCTNRTTNRSSSDNDFTCNREITIIINNELIID